MQEQERRNDPEFAGGLTAAIITIIVLALLAAFVFDRDANTYITVNNLDAGRVVIEAQTANSDMSGVANITLAEGELLEVRSEMTGQSTIQIQVGDVLEESFMAAGIWQFDIPAGHYVVRVFPHDGATGSMYILATSAGSKP